MRLLDPIPGIGHVLFITSVVNTRLPLFLDPVFARIVLDALSYPQPASMRLLAFVVMPDHVHWIAAFPEGVDPARVARAFHSFTAHAILARLEADGRECDLARLALPGAKDRGSRVWLDPFVKHVMSRRFLIEKIEYVHNNPVAKRWRLADDRDAYPWSSAAFYDLDEKPPIPVTHCGTLAA
jgi:REP element-mobilizing transposase RayT